MRLTTEDEVSQPHRLPSKRFVLRLVVAIAAAGILTPFAVLLTVANRYARAHTQPDCPGLFNSPADSGLDFEEVTITARDGVRVGGWYIPSRNDAALVAAPGFNGNRSHALHDFGFLATEGYGLVVFDQRNCTDPRLPQTLGYSEAQDMLGAVDFLHTEENIEGIGAIGFSAGGVTTLLAAAQEPAIEAVVELGGYHNLEADILDLQYEHPWYDALMRWLIVEAFRRQTGIHPRDASPVDVVGQISPRPLLLIYGEYEALGGQLLFEAAGEPKELWLVEGAEHGGYRAAAPGEYETRVTEFFDMQLLDGASTNTD